MRRALLLSFATLALAPAAPASADSLVWPLHGGFCPPERGPYCEVDLWRADADGGNARVVGHGEAGRSGLRNPQWSRDGGRIVFHQSFDETPETMDPVEGQEIFSMAADGSDLRRLTGGGSTLDMQPAISPSGREIAWWRSGFDASIGFEVGGIWLMGAGGSDQRKLVDLPGNESTPDFSADGKRVAFTRNLRRDRGIDIASVWSVDRDGGDLRQLSTGDLPARVPKFSPDGRFLSFFSGNGVIVVALDGSGTRFYELGGNTAAWSSDGRYLAVLGVPPGEGQFSIWRIDTDRPDAPPLRVRDVRGHTGGWLAYPSWVTDDPPAQRRDRSAPSFLVGVEAPRRGGSFRSSLRVVGGRRAARPLTVREPRRLRFAAADGSGLKRVEASVTATGRSPRFHRLRTHRDWRRVTRRLGRGNYVLRVRSRDAKGNARRGGRPLKLRVR